jgi:hypothetical protein
VEGFPLRKLAHVRGVNVNVVARDLAVARAAILDQVRAALMTSTGMSAEDVAAVVNALFTRVNLGINATLRSGERALLQD